MHRQYGRAAVGVALAALATGLLAPACSSDTTTPATAHKPPKTGTTEATDAGEWSNQYNVVDVGDGSTPAPFLFDKVADPYPADSGTACEAFATDYPVSRACLCTHCYDLMHQCDALEGCIQIRACIWKSGCQDTNSCYLLKMSGDPTGCVDVIDKWGNTGDAVAIATDLLQCGQKPAAGCPTMAQ